MRNNEHKPQRMQVPTPVIKEDAPSELRRRLKDTEQREVALSGGNDPLGQPRKNEKPDKFSDETSADPASDVAS